VGPEWTQQLNQLAPGFVPFRNGLYNIANGALTPFRPEMHLSVKFDFDAPAAGEAFANEEADVRRIFSELFPEQALRSEVMKRIASSFFRGKPMEGKYFLQLFAGGDNGKTLLFLILKTAFPAWIQMVPVEHLLRTRHGTNPNAAAEWKMDAMGARLLLFEEPTAGAVFDGALLKLMRGGGFMTGRNLYQHNVTYRPTSRVVISANAPIEVDPPDKALLNSMHAYAMPATFVEAGDPRLGPPPAPNVFPKIDGLDERFAQRPYRLALFNVLREYYVEYERDGLDKRNGQPQRSAFDRRDIYEEAHGRTDAEWFDAYFDVASVDDGTRLRLRDIHATLREHEYPGSEKHLSSWMRMHFAGHASVKTVDHSGVKKWVCIVPKPDAEGEDDDDTF
jgi:phage/plasmid-associated DNA primase